MVRGVMEGLALSGDCGHCDFPVLVGYLLSTLLTTVKAAIKEEIK